MKRRNFLFLPAIALGLLLGVACKKNDSKNDARTVANLSGTYKLSALVWAYGGISINVYDSLPACEKDNLIKLDTNMTATYIDAGTVCDPAEDSSGTWALSGDSIYLGGNAGKITSFDGTKLVITGKIEDEPSGTGTTTLVKQ